MHPQSRLLKGNSTPGEVSHRRTFSEICLSQVTGGAANKYSPDEAEAKEAKVHNERVRRDSANRQREKEKFLRDLVQKGKEVLKT